MPKAPENPEPHGCTEELTLDHLGPGELGKLSVPGLNVHTATSTASQKENVRQPATSSKYSVIQNPEFHPETKANISHLLHEIQNDRAPQALKILIFHKLTLNLLSNKQWPKLTRD